MLKQQQFRSQMEMENALVEFLMSNYLVHHRNLDTQAHMT